jgi:hypothetical protein
VDKAKGTRPHDATNHPRYPCLMACEECDRLSSEFEDRGMAYTVAIQTLTAKASVTPRNEYSKLRIAVEDARLEWEVSRRDLLKHQATHI